MHEQNSLVFGIFMSVFEKPEDDRTLHELGEAGKNRTSGAARAVAGRCLMLEVQAVEPLLVKFYCDHTQ